MANAKRASMREGPLAALFRKTEDAEGEAAEPSSGEPASAVPAKKARASEAPPAHPRESGLPHPGLGASPDAPEEPPRVATPRERLRHAFSSEIPENMMERPAT